MKLSEAIRKGSQIRPQAFGNYKQHKKGQPCTCAMGAAYESCTGELPPYQGNADANAIVQKAIDSCVVNSPLNLQAMHPVRNWSQNVMGIIISLNDDHRWSREKIADWIEGLGY